jgi:hypothetical protein
MPIGLVVPNRANNLQRLKINSRKTGKSKNNLL